MPSHDHPLLEKNKELDRLFWEKLASSVGTASGEEEKKEEVSAEWREIKAWLTGFDTEMKAAIVLMCSPAKDERKPFQEKYDAREILQSLVKGIKEEWLEQSDVVRIAKALIYNRLG